MGNGRKYLKFGDFSLDTDTYELSDKSCEIVRLQQQPGRVLMLLASRANELVTREEIQKLLWSDDTFVDFEQGVNYCIKQIRVALSDDARTPRFVETLPRRGYRFIAPVESLNGNSSSQKIAAESEVHAKPKSFRSFTYVLAVAAVFLLGTALVWNFGAAKEPVGLTSRNPEAQDAYLKGQHLFQKGDAPSIRQSISFFDQAISADEKFASAFVARADAFYHLGLVGSGRTAEVFPKAKSDAVRAIELNEGFADAYAILGSIAFRYDWNFAEAESHFKRALKIAPDSANALHDYAWFLTSQGRFEDAIENIEKAQSFEPTSARINIDVGWIYARARRYDSALVQMRRTLDLEPENVAARQCLECAYFNKQMFAESVENGVSLMKQSGASDEDLAKIREVEPREGIKRIEVWRLRQMELEEGRTYVPAYLFAIQSAAVGDKEKALRYLEKAFQERDTGLVMFKVEQVWDKFRDDPRYQEMLKKIGFN